MNENTKVETLTTLIDSNCRNGQFFTVEFEKKDGTPRTMNCRLGVKKYLKGGVNTTDHIKSILTVFCRKAMDYRNINLKKVTKLAFAGGNEFKFKNEEA